MGRLYISSLYINQLSLHNLCPVSNYYHKTRLDTGFVVISLVFWHVLTSLPSFGRAPFSLNYHVKLNQNYILIYSLSLNGKPERAFQNRKFSPATFLSVRAKHIQLPTAPQCVLIHALTRSFRLHFHVFSAHLPITPAAIVLFNFLSVYFVSDFIIPDFPTFLFSFHYNRTLEVASF